MSTRIVCVVMLLTASALAQSTGRISGSVIDSSGSPVPAAQVQLMLPDSTTPILTTATTTDGLFVLPGVRADFYDLAVEMKGFRREVRRRIKVDAATELSLPPIKLEVAAVAETVEVNAELQAVQTSSVEITTNIRNEQIRQLPVLNRSPLALISTQAGVGANFRSNTTINGLRTSYTNITIEGINIQDNFIRTNALDFLPNLLLLDQVAEFTISTSNTNVTQGNGSAQVTFVTPSGTNEYHGALYWYNRNSAAAANSWFNNRNGVKKAFLNQNQLGGRLGGRIIRDKLFFYANFEGYRQHQQSTATRTLLTADARQGIFTYEDTSGQVRKANVLQLAGVPADPQVQQILQQVPGPDKINRFDTGDSRESLLKNTAGYSFLTRNNRIRNNLTGKIDYLHSVKHVFSVSYLWNSDLLDRPDQSNDYSLVPKVKNDDTGDLLSLTYRWSPSPSMTNELRGGYNLAPALFLSSEKFGSYILGGFSFSNPLNTFRDQGRYTDTYNLAENFTYLRGRHTIQAGFQSQLIRVAPFNDAGNLPTYTLGISGANTLGLTAEKLPGVRAQDVGIANALLATHAGFLSSYSQTFNVTSRTSGFVSGASNKRNFTLNNYAFYGQDGWKVVPRLTLTLGLRWEYFSPVDESGALALLPQLVNSNPIQTLLSNATLDFAGSAVGRPWYSKDFNNFAPNVGLAWDMFGDGRMSLRAGYSVNYANDEFIRAVDNNTATNAGLAQGVSVINQTTRISQGLPPVQTPVFKVPRTFEDNYRLNTQSAFGIPDPGLRTPYVQQWSLSIQRRLLDGLLEVRYLGNHSTKQFRGFDYNQVIIRENGFLDDFLRAYSNGNLARAATGAFNPNYNPAIAGSQPLTLFPRLVGGGNLNNATFRNLVETGQVGELANQYQIGGFNGPVNFYRNPLALGTNMVTNYSNGTYNALQVDFNRRFSRGVQFQANYTYSKVMSDAAGDAQTRFEAFLDMNNAKLERARTPFDLTHSIKANGVWELPFGEGRRFSYRPLRKLIGGWAVSSILVRNSGSPFGVYSGRSTLNRSARSGENSANTVLNKAQLDDLFGLRLTGNGPYFIKASAIGQDGRGTAADGQAPFSGQAFFNPGPGTLGGLQRRMFSGPWTLNFNFAVLKTTNITERQSVEFRMESTNFVNHPSFGLGDQDINSTNFGRVTSTAVGPRVIQFGLYYRF